MPISTQPEEVRFRTDGAKCGLQFMVPPCAPPRKLGVCASKREDTAGKITISTLFELCPFFQELTRSANLHPTGKRPVLRRMPQNVRLPYDVQCLFQGVDAQHQSPPRPSGTPGNPWIGFPTMKQSTGLFHLPS